MGDIHSCSYFCERPACVLAQRNELRAALAEHDAQPAAQQEPVAWIDPSYFQCKRWGYTVSPINICLEQAPLYAAPEAPKPLTDEQMRYLVKECGLDWQRGYMPLFDGDPTNRYAVLIEAARSTI